MILRNMMLTYSANSRAVDASHSVLGVTGIFELDESEAGRIAGHPHIPEWAVLCERVLQLVLGGVVAEVADVNFAGDVPITVARHDDYFDNLKDIESKSENRIKSTAKN